MSRGVTRQVLCQECHGPLGEAPKVVGQGWSCACCASFPAVAPPDLDDEPTTPFQRREQTR